ncbi:Co/Zn/Cd efflux system component [Pseudomonas sp. TE12234]
MVILTLLSIVAIAMVMVMVMVMVMALQLDVITGLAVSVYNFKRAISVLRVRQLIAFMG